KAMETTATSCLFFASEGNGSSVRRHRVSGAISGTLIHSLADYRPTACPMFLPGAFRRKIRKPAGSKGRWKSRSQCKLSPWLFVLVGCDLYDEIPHTTTGYRLRSGNVYGAHASAS